MSVSFFYFYFIFCDYTYFLINGVTEKPNFVLDLFPLGTTGALIFDSL